MFFSSKLCSAKPHILFLNFFIRQKMTKQCWKYILIYQKKVFCLCFISRLIHIIQNDFDVPRLVPMTPHLVLPLENIWLLSNRMHQNIGTIDKYYQTARVWGRPFDCLVHSCKSLIRGPELYWENTTSSLFSRWFCETFQNSCLWLHWLYQKMIAGLRARLHILLLMLNAFKRIN